MNFFETLLTILSSWSAILYGAFWLAITVMLIAFVHEFGHYIVARMCGVKVEAFAVGMGREIFGWTAKSGTRWKICLFPIGGYVKMLGQSDIPVMSGDVDDNPQSFANKSNFQRILISIAGPVANVILAFVILLGIFLSHGKTIIPPVIGEVEKDSAAMKFGIRKGDIITRVNNREISDFMQIRREVLMSGCKKSLSVELQRNGKSLDIQVTPEYKMLDEAKGSGGSCVLGVAPERNIKVINYSFFKGFGEALKDTKLLVKDTVRGVFQLITGKRSLRELSGPLKIGKVSHEASKSGLTKFLGLIAIVSVGVGVMNLLPIPVLDGGHIFMNLIEMIIRRPLSSRLQYYIYQAGMAIVMAMMALGVVNDFKYLIKL